MGVNKQPNLIVAGERELQYGKEEARMNSVVLDCSWEYHFLKSDVLK